MSRDSSEVIYVPIPGNLNLQLTGPMFLTWSHQTVRDATLPFWVNAALALIRTILGFQEFVGRDKGMVGGPNDLKLISGLPVRKLWTAKRCGKSEGGGSIWTSTVFWD